MVPEFEEFILPTLQVLSEGKTRTLQEVRDAVIARFGFTPEQLAETTRSGNNTKVIDRTDWSITYLVQASLVERPVRASARITFAGMELLENPPKIISRDFLVSHYPTFKDFNNRRKKKKEPVQATKSFLQTRDLSKVEDSSLSEMRYSLIELKNAIAAFEKNGCSATQEQLAQVANLETKIKEFEASQDASRIVPHVIKLMEEKLPDKDYVLMFKRVNGITYYLYSNNEDIINLVPDSASTWTTDEPEKSSRKRRPNLNFFQMGLITGDELTYNDDENIKVTVVSENRVEYNGQEYSLTKLTQKLKNLDHAIQPTGEWSFEGQNLLELYNDTFPPEKE